MKAANKNTIPITSESDILCAFRNLTSSYDERTLHTVSYTHLDVYKRQEYITSKAFPFPPVGEYAPALPDILTATE